MGANTDGFGVEELLSGLAETGLGLGSWRRPCRASSLRA